MPQNLIDFEQLNIVYSVGDVGLLNKTKYTPALLPFANATVEFLNSFSKKLLLNPKAKLFPDVVTLAFWMRKASVLKLKERFLNDEIFRLGRGVAFHIAPSNVAVNYAYSFVTGLLCGNVNIVRLPSKYFEQVEIINDACNCVLNDFPEMKPYIILIKYGHDEAINEALSSIADTRIIWGGDNTISEIRKAHLNPRATEITFADRYSIAVIDADEYLKIENKEKTALDFWNDTYLSDQNACTSPRVVFWLGNEIEKAKVEFWERAYKIVNKQYEIQGVQSVNKLTTACLLAVAKDKVILEPKLDNLLYRVKVDKLDDSLMEFKENSGFFIECNGKNITELRAICNNKRCQTISYIGKKDMFKPLLISGICGVDRIVSIGKTMDFDIIWDGYNLFERLTRTISVI